MPFAIVWWDYFNFEQNWPHGESFDFRSLMSVSSFSALIHLVGFFARAGFVFALVSGICAFSFCFSLFVGCLFVAFWIRIRLLGRYFPFPMLNRSSRKCLARKGFSSVVFVTISFRASWRGHLWKVSRGLFVVALLISQCVEPTMSNDTTGRQVKIKMDGIPLFQIFSESYPSRPLFDIYSPCLGFPGEGPTGAFSFISANVSSCPKYRDHIASFSAYDSNGVAAMFLQESRVPKSSAVSLLKSLILQGWI